MRVPRTRLTGDPLTVGYSPASCVRVPGAAHRSVVGHPPDHTRLPRGNAGEATAYERASARGRPWRVRTHRWERGSRDARVVQGTRVRIAQRRGDVKRMMDRIRWPWTAEREQTPGDRFEVTGQLSGRNAGFPGTGIKVRNARPSSLRFGKGPDPTGLELRSDWCASNPRRKPERPRAYYQRVETSLGLSDPPAALASARGSWCLGVLVLL